MPIKPILFNKQISTEMVRAILDGRKSCTRRLVKPQPDEKHTFPLGFVTDSTEKKEVGCFGFGINEYGGSIQYAKPPYQPGDTLYVRETWMDYAGLTMYKADCDIYRLDSLNFAGFVWHPSIHMPKGAARIWLRATDVRVERLQEIDGKGCVKEGIEEEHLKYVGDEFVKGMFHDLWDSTIKKSDLDRYSWDANPWVWVIGFERCEKPKGV